MLFKDFSSLIQRWREQIQGKVGQSKVTKDRPGVSLSKTDNDDERNREISADDELRKATKKAQDLSNAIKDIRDELNILKATAQYQQDVQEALNMSQEQVHWRQEQEHMSQGDFHRWNQQWPMMARLQRLQANLSAAHVVNDIREMDNVAHRVQAAVGTWCVPWMNQTLTQKNLGQYHSITSAK